MGRDTHIVPGLTEPGRLPPTAYRVILDLSLYSARNLERRLRFWMTPISFWKRPSYTLASKRRATASSQSEDVQSERATHISFVLMRVLGDLFIGSFTTWYSRTTFRRPRQSRRFLNGSTIFSASETTKANKTLHPTAGNAPV